MPLLVNLITTHLTTLKIAVDTTTLNTYFWVFFTYSAHIFHSHLPSHCPKLKKSATILLKFEVSSKIDDLFPSLKKNCIYRNAGPPIPMLPYSTDETCLAGIPLRFHPHCPSP